LINSLCIDSQGDNRFLFHIQCIQPGRWWVLLMGGL